MARMSLDSRCRVPLDPSWSLASVNPDDTLGLEKAAAAARHDDCVKALGDLQDRLYAMDRWAVLVIFQAMDAAGKDSTIKHVMSGINPAGCQVFSFKAPSDEELDHDYLWRSQRALPERGRIGVHNRSHYEEVIVTRVHPEILARQRVPRWPAPAALWPARLRQINEFEQHLHDNGTLILKFFLHISKGEQRKRFLSRLDEPEKHWKFSPRDVRERAHWDDYMHAYEQAIRGTSTPWAPWFVIPGNKKWVSRTAVAEILRTSLEKLDLRFPTVPPDREKEWDEARELLSKER
jgi:PPK2 family polyphosphate:nucleotide phosphotransferase